MLSVRLSSQYCVSAREEVSLCRNISLLFILINCRTQSENLHRVKLAQYIFFSYSKGPGQHCCISSITFAQLPKDQIMYYTLTPTL